MTRALNKQQERSRRLSEGQKRVEAWLTPEAYKALEQIKAREGCDSTEAINRALMVVRAVK